MTFLEIAIFFTVVAAGLIFAFCLDIRIERRRREEKKRYDDLREAYMDLLNKQEESYRDMLRSVINGYERIVKGMITNEHGK